MSIQFSRSRHSGLRILAAIGTLLFACVGGHIPPSTFHFTNVVPNPGAGIGGWKVAQVLVILAKISPIFPETATCDVEVGVPEVNFKGPVLDELAQEAAAKAADEAARIVFKERQPTVLVCEQFRNHMHFIMAAQDTGILPGAKVTRFQTSGVPRTTFP